jgi:hypothetical protein
MELYLESCWRDIEWWMNVESLVADSWMIKLRQLSELMNVIKLESYDVCPILQQAIKQNIPIVSIE